MFNKSYEDRLIEWSNFRNSLETSPSPFEDLIEFYSAAPTVSRHTDPYEKTMWPAPWELLEENQYCDFCRVLGYCYSLQLTDRFKDSKIEIHIITSTDETEYILYINDWILGYGDKGFIHRADLPPVFKPQVVYPMDSQQ